MPSFYNGYPWQTTNYPGSVYPSTGVQVPSISVPQYMINVDGEMAARAWQMPPNLPPNTIIPLYDLDGQHVYFKSIDAYGRINPLRKGKIVFEDESVTLPPAQQTSGSSQPEMPDMSKYVTKDDLNSFKQELRNMIQTNQNGSNNQRNSSFRGDKHE